MCSVLQLQSQEHTLEYKVITHGGSGVASDKEKDISREE